jgi:hypothetical protein
MVKGLAIFQEWFKGFEERTKNMFLCNSAFN